MARLKQSVTLCEAHTHATFDSVNQTRESHIGEPSQQSFGEALRGP
jgi:hypothetical protein